MEKLKNNKVLKDYEFLQDKDGNILKEYKNSNIYVLETIDKYFPYNLYICKDNELIYLDSIKEKYYYELEKEWRKWKKLIGNM